MNRSGGARREAESRDDVPSAGPGQIVARAAVCKGFDPAVRWASGRGGFRGLRPESTSALVDQRAHHPGLVAHTT